jgi:hypothetical protein
VIIIDVKQAPLCLGLTAEIENIQRNSVHILVDCTVIREQWGRSG